MPRRRRGEGGQDGDGVADYRYGARRLNNPRAGLVSAEQATRETKRTPYTYDSHLSPQLVWAGKPGLKAIEVEDAAGIEVEDVALHVHERVSTRAILEVVQRPETKQPGLFSDPQLPLDQALKFYQHQVNSRESRITNAGRMLEYAR